MKRRGGALPAQGGRGRADASCDDETALQGDDIVVMSSDKAGGMNQKPLPPGGSSSNLRCRYYWIFLAVILIYFICVFGLGSAIFFRNNGHDELRQQQQQRTPRAGEEENSLLSPKTYKAERIMSLKESNENNNNNNKEDEEPVIIAYVGSLIKCSKSLKTVGFLDAAAILRHSIHKQSVYATPNPPFKSRYGYKMYAIVHTDCQHHAPVLQKLGYTTLIRDTPVQLHEIQNTWYRTHVDGEMCCGSAEFIKLYAYLLFEHPIVVHFDFDVAMLQPLDELYDAMLYPPTSARGKQARAKIQLEYPHEPLPDKIDAFFTRDVTSSRPFERQMVVQGGFLVARPSQEDFDKYMEIIKIGNYTGGSGLYSGWESLGYGGFQGSKAYQGLVAYFYDRFRPGTFVELNVCRYNQVVADVKWRGPSRFQEHHMECRRPPRDGNHSNNFDCEDCRVTPPHLVKTVHYTACKKPWECLMPYPRKGKERDAYRLSNLNNVTTCLLMLKEWFLLRQDFENALHVASEGKAKLSERDGSFQRDTFLGYCRRSSQYIPLEAPPDDFDLSVMYGL